MTGHELGHNLGLHHAGSWDCTGASGQAVSISSSCTLNEYNDPFDVMGAHGSRHSHGWNLQRLGVLPASNVQTVSSSGTYSMTSALDSTTDPTTLRMPRTYAADGTVQDWYYLEIRKSGGVFDSFSLTDWAVKGVSIRVDDDPALTTRSRLLDTHPGGSIYDAPLQPGETFSDGHISVKTVSAGSGTATRVRSTCRRRRSTSSRRPRRRACQHACSPTGCGWHGTAPPTTSACSAYPVYRDGVEIGSSPDQLVDDTTVLPGRHVYTVYAQDGAGNLSPASAPTWSPCPGRRPRISARLDGSHGAAAAAVPAPPARRAPAADRQGDATAGIARIELRIDGHRVRVRRASRVSYRWRQRPGRHRSRWSPSTSAATAASTS